MGVAPVTKRLSVPLLSVEGDDSDGTLCRRRMFLSYAAHVMLLAAVSTEVNSAIPSLSCCEAASLGMSFARASAARWGALACQGHAPGQGIDHRRELRRRWSGQRLDAHLECAHRAFEVSQRSHPLFA